MRITPLDIQQKQFPMKLRGFDVEKVYAFLEAVREEMENLIRENDSLKKSLQHFKDQSNVHSVLEKLLEEFASLKGRMQRLEDQSKEHKV